MRRCCPWARRRTLKIIRYSARLALAYTPPGEARQRLENLEKSIGTSRCVRDGRLQAPCVFAMQAWGAHARRHPRPCRIDAADWAGPCTPPPPRNPSPCRKAYRLGKFLQHVQALRALQLTPGWRGPVEALALAGEGAYYFLDQATW
jgi:hypothetical protein